MTSLEADGLLAEALTAAELLNLPNLSAAVTLRAITASPRSISIADARQADLPLIFVNPAFERLSGYMSKEVVGKNCRFLQGPDTGKAEVDRLAQGITAAEPVTVTVLNYRKDGTAFWNEISVAPIFDDKGEVTHYVGVQADVTAAVEAHGNREEAYRSERSAHQQARDVNSRLQAILTQMPSGVLLAEAPSGRLLLGNEQMERVFRHPFIAGDSIEEYGRYAGFHADGRRLEPHEWPLARSVLSGEVVTDEEVTIERGDGTTGIILVRSAPIHDENDDIVAAIELFDDITARKEAERDLALAREKSAALAKSLQRSLLPAALPVVDGFQFGAAYSPVGEGLDVGGDFYDVFEQRDGEWIMVIGDVMGKGVDAAAVTSLARHALRTAALRARRPVPLLTVLNEALLREGDNRPFCTVAAAVLNRSREGARLTLSLGGHPKPFVVRSSGEVQPIGEPGTLMGVIDEVSLEEVEYELHPGDFVVMYTDGVTEAHDESKFLGDEGLQRILSDLATRDLDAQGFADAVQAEVMRFLGADLKDDLAVLVARVVASKFPGGTHL